MSYHRATACTTSQHTPHTPIANTLAAAAISANHAAPDASIDDVHAATMLCWTLAIHVGFNHHSQVALGPTPTGWQQWAIQLAVHQEETGSCADLTVVVKSLIANNTMLCLKLRTSIPQHLVDAAHLVHEATEPQVQQHH
jgi:hypothetical protein